MASLRADAERARRRRARRVGAVGFAAAAALPIVLWHRVIADIAGEFPVCEDVAARSVALPFFPAMTEGQVQRVAAALAEAVGQGP